jgi:hypothetical protein
LTKPPCIVCELWWVLSPPIKSAIEMQNRKNACIYPNCSLSGRAFSRANKQAMQDRLVEELTEGQVLVASMTNHSCYFKFIKLKLPVSDCSMASWQLVQGYEKLE